MVRAGDFFYIPAGAPHLPYNPSEERPASRSSRAPIRTNRRASCCCPNSTKSCSRRADPWPAKKTQETFKPRQRRRRRKISQVADRAERDRASRREVFVQDAAARRGYGRRERPNFAFRANPFGVRTRISICLRRAQAHLACNAPRSAAAGEATCDAYGTPGRRRHYGAAREESGQGS